MHPATTPARSTLRALSAWRTLALCVTLILCFSASAHAQLSGSYTIGGTGANYASIESAISALNGAGVSGAVTFLINSGTITPPTSGYTLGAVTGMSSSNTVTFKPAASATVVISGATSQYNVYSIFNFTNGAKYYVIDGSNSSGGTTRDMTIRQTDPYYQGTIGFQNNADNNTVKNCILQANAQYYTPSYQTGIIFFGYTNTTSGNDSNLIQNNQIGDYTGTNRSTIAIYGYGNNSSYPNRGNRIIGNDFVNYGHGSYNSTAMGVYLNYYMVGTIIQGNDFHMTMAPAATSIYTLYLYHYYGYCYNTIVDGNRFYNIATANNIGSRYDINDYEYYNTTSSTTTIVNNMFSYKEPGTIQYMAIYGYQYQSNSNLTVNLYHNSLYLGGVGSGGTNYCFYRYPYNSSSSYNTTNFKNNIWYSERSGSGTTYGIYSNGYTNSFYLDYNLFSMNSTSSSYTGYWTSTLYTLASWQSSSGQDANSVGGSPRYVDPMNGNLHISASARTPVEGAGTPISSVPKDFDGATRSTTAPDIGSDEGSFTAPASNDVAAERITNPLNAMVFRSSTSFTPSGMVLNAGTSSQSNVAVRFRIWNTSTGVLAYHDIQTISSLSGLTMQSQSFNQTGNQSGTTALAAGTYAYEFRAELAGDADTTDNAKYGTIYVKDPLCGNYTINPAAAASATNYQTFTAVTNDLNAVGVSCATTFLISGGTYGPAETFPIELKAASGMSATNTVTFKPASGATVFMSGASGNAIFSIDHGSYYTLDGSNTTGGTTRDWTIENLGSSAAVRLINVASYNNVMNLSMRANNAQYSYSSAGAGVVSISYPSSTYAGGNSFNLIKNNLIGDTTGTVRSAVGIQMHGYGTSSSTYFSSSNMIDGNDIVNFGNPGYSVGYGIMAGYYTPVNLKIFRNKIHLTTTTNTSNLQQMYGIYDYYRLYENGQDTIAYNQIYNLKTAHTSPYQYGIYCVYPGYYTNGNSYTIHNNVIMLKDGYYHYGLFMQYTGSSSSYVNNVNIVHNTIYGSGAQYPQYAVYLYYNFGTSSFKNNIVNWNEGTGYYLFQIQYWDYGTFTMDRNIYSTGTYTPTYYMYSPVTGTSVSTTSLATWQSGTGRDANSVSQASIPFIDAANGDFHINPQPVFFGESRGQALGYLYDFEGDSVGSSRVDLQACKLEYSIVSPK